MPRYPVIIEQRVRQSAVAAIGTRLVTRNEVLKIVKIVAKACDYKRGDFPLEDTTTDIINHYAPDQIIE